MNPAAQQPIPDEIARLVDWQIEQALERGDGPSRARDDGRPVLTPLWPATCVPMSLRCPEGLDLRP